MHEIVCLDWARVGTGSVKLTRDPTRPGWEWPVTRIDPVTGMCVTALPWLCELLHKVHYIWDMRQGTSSPGHLSLKYNLQDIWGRRHEVHAFCLKCLAEKCFTTLNKNPDQVFVELTCDPTRPILLTRFQLWTELILIAYACCLIAKFGRLYSHTRLQIYTMWVRTLEIRRVYVFSRGFMHETFVLSYITN